jgi:hypothetical protein
MDAGGVVEDVDVLEMAFASSTRVVKRRLSGSSTCIREQNASITVLPPLWPSTGCDQGAVG